MQEISKVETTVLAQATAIAENAGFGSWRMRLAGEGVGMFLCVRFGMAPELLHVQAHIESN